MQKKIGILRGGIGKNYHRSLKKGGEIISHILENLSHKWKPVDVLVDKDGVWHLGGVPIKPAELMHKVDMVWNTAHPQHSAVLKSFSIPFIGPDHFHSVLEESRDMLRKHMQKIGLPMPRSMVLPVYQPDFDGPRDEYAVKKAGGVHQKFGAPWMVRSFTPDKSMAIHLAKTFPELVDAIEDGVAHGDSILVEEFIAGKVASLHTVRGFRGDLPALPNGREQAGEIYVFPLGNTFGIFSNPEKEMLSDIARRVHSHVGEPYYLKSDFVLDSRGKIHLLQIEFMPDINPGSHFGEVCESVGVKSHHVIEHILEQP